MDVPFQVKALHEYKSDYDDDLTFPAGAAITVTDIEDDDWYSGTYNGKTGMFPKNFVEKIAAESLEGPKEASPPVAPGSSAPVEKSSFSGSAGPAAGAVNAPIDTKEIVQGDEETESPSPPASEAHPVPIPGSIPSERAPEPSKALEPPKVPKPALFPQPPQSDRSHVARGYNDVVENQRVVRETDETPPVESNEPKMSLKERIAMLQQRQKEEAEREAAAAKRKEERKKKLEEERKLKAAHAQPAVSHAELGATTTGDSLDPPSISQEIPQRNSLDSDVPHEDIPRQASGASSLITSHTTEHQLARSLTGDSFKEMNETIPENDSAEKVGGTATNDEEIEETEETEDDEDLRRRRLVERMAKISGGRNMFGMMGMPNPFGGTPPAAVSKPKATAEPEEKEQDLALEPQIQGPTPAGKAKRMGIPIPGIASFSTPDSLLEEKVPEASLAKEAEIPKYDGDEEDDVSEDRELTFHSEAGIATEEVVRQEKDALAHPENLAETNDRAPDTKNDLHDNSNPSMDIMSETAAAHDSEVAGYEADADVSDRGKLPELDQLSNKESHAVESNDKEFTLTSPPIPSVPPIPQRPTENKLIIDPSSSARAPPPPPPDAAPASPIEQRRISERAAPPPIPTDAVPGSQTGSQQMRQKPPPPPVPSESPLPPVPPIPPIPVSGLGHQDQRVEDADDVEVSDEEGYVRLSDVPASSLPPDKSSTFSYPPPPPTTVPQAPLRKSLTGSLKRASTEIPRRQSAEFKESKAEQDQSALNAADLKAELGNIEESSGWWIKGDAPDSLNHKLGVDFVYEVDTHKIVRRGGKEFIYKDYYLLFHDLSQLLVELQYEAQDPRATVQINDFDMESSPKIRKDLLHGFSFKYGSTVADFAEGTVGSKLAGGVVQESLKHLYSKQPDFIQPIGEKSFGAAIYKNVNNNVSKIDEIRPGDILCMRHAKFPSHKGLGGIGAKNLILGEGNNIYSAVVVEYDPKKDKVKVIEDGKGGVVKKESYKFSEMRSGKVRIFRIISRDCVGW